MVENVDHHHNRNLSVRKQVQVQHGRNNLEFFAFDDLPQGALHASVRLKQPVILKMAFAHTVFDEKTNVWPDLQIVSSKRTKFLKNIEVTFLGFPKNIHRNTAGVVHHSGI